MMESRKGGHIMNVKPLDYSTLTKEQFDAEIEKVSLISKQEEFIQLMKLKKK